MLANPSFQSRPPFLRYKGRRLSFSSFPPLYLRSRQPPLPSLCLLLSTSGNKFGVRALSESEVSESTITGDGGQYIPEPYSVKIPVGDRHGDSSSVGNSHRRRSSLESLFCYDKAIPEEIIEKPIGLSLAEKVIGNNPRCTDCQAKGAILCATCSGSGLYVDSILESQGIIVKVRCLGCGGIGNIMCSECGGRGHL